MLGANIFLIIMMLIIISAAISMPYIEEKCYYERNKKLCRDTVPKLAFMLCLTSACLVTYNILFFLIR